jgi:hypothetical protein
MYYQDKDKDGFGDKETSMAACSQPEGWVTNSADCNDGNKEVYPGQQAYFEQGYPKPGAPQGISFDYDCNGVEDPSPLDTKNPTCPGVVLGCDKSGYAPGNRTGPGVDPYCGVKTRNSCTVSGLSCNSNISTVANGFRCR